MYSLKTSDVDYDAIVGEEPELLGLSMYDVTRPTVYHTCGKLEKKRPQMKIAIGGSSATFLKDQILKQNPVIDFIVVGEGESTFLKLAQAIEGRCYLYTRRPSERTSIFASRNRIYCSDYNTDKNVDDLSFRDRESRFKRYPVSLKIRRTI